MIRNIHTRFSFNVNAKATQLRATRMRYGRFLNTSSVDVKVRDSNWVVPWDANEPVMVKIKGGQWRNRGF